MRPLGPLPVTIANPFRQPGLPLFEPKWQRAIVTQLASISLPVGELDIPQVIQLIARGRPLTEVPRRPVATVAKGLRLLIDQGESMEPYRLDVAELVRSFRRTIGAARVSAHGYRGLPEWGCPTVSSRSPSVRRHPECRWLSSAIWGFRHARLLRCTLRKRSGAASYSV